VPAAAASLIPTALDQLTHTPDPPTSPATALTRIADPRDHLAAVPDPRHRRGIRHTITTTLLIAAAATDSSDQTCSAVAVLGVTA
jgi:hypothetical protein